MRTLFYDFETTGLDPNKAAPLTLGLAGETGPVRQYGFGLKFLLDQGFLEQKSGQLLETGTGTAVAALDATGWGWVGDAKQAASKAHGLGFAPGPEPRFMFPEGTTVLNTSAEASEVLGPFAGAKVVGYNSKRYDRGFLNRLLGGLGLGAPGAEHDVYEWSKDNVEAGSGRQKLTAVTATVFGESQAVLTERAHDAAYDVTLTRALYQVTADGGSLEAAQKKLVLVAGLMCCCPGQQVPTRLSLTWLLTPQKLPPLLLPTGPLVFGNVWAVTCQAQQQKQLQNNAWLVCC